MTAWTSSPYWRCGLPQRISSGPRRGTRSLHCKRSRALEQGKARRPKGTVQAEGDTGDPGSPATSLVSTPPATGRIRSGGSPSYKNHWRKPVLCGLRQYRVEHYPVGGREKECRHSLSSPDTHRTVMLALRCRRISRLLKKDEQSRRIFTGVSGGRPYSFNPERTSMMNTKSLGLFVVSMLLVASAGAEGRSEKNALPALDGYSVRVWATGTAGFTNPDSIEWDRGHVWVGYQNVTSKTGGDGQFSTVVEYDSDGNMLRTFAVPGHCDGLRIDPATHTVWASSNEDGNPGLVSIDQPSGTITTYSFAPTAHGGGFDDMAFVNGKMFIAASNPTLDANGA